MKRLLLTMLMVFGSILLFAQGSVKGRVLDDQGEGLPSATVLVDGTAIGTVTDFDGNFEIRVPSKNYTLRISFVGFKDQIIESDKTDLGEITMISGVQELTTLEIIASRGTVETPYTFTDVSKKDLQETLGSQDLPLALNSTPSFYSTNQGGGAGDARLNVRGFNQRNVAIMINGVPVNDMENGWVYWSNWDGLGDAAQSIQLQRGMSPINLAVPSIGGTMNIITDPAAKSKGFAYKQEAGSWGFKKATASFNTGLIDNKWAMSGTVVRKTGDGFAQGTYTDAWAYYLGTSYQLNSANKFELFVVGAPQRHGQNLYRQNLGAYSREYAASLNSYSDAALDDFREVGRDFNQNFAPVNPDYTDNQYYKMYGNRSLHTRSGDNFLMERENFFHKPQVNLNWYHSFSDKMQWTTIGYWSGGQGGGSGTFGEVLRYDDNYNSSSNAPFFFGPSPWHWNWDETIAINQAPAGTAWSNDFDSGVKSGDGESIGVLRNSRNNQWTIGAISKLFYDVNDNLSIQFGIDWRTAEIDHFREIRDLLGGQYFRFTGNQFESTEEQYRKRLGDKIDYDYTNTVNWIGFYGQGSYQVNNLTATLMGGFTSTKYEHTNHFLQGTGGGKLTMNPDALTGYQVKGGLSYKFSETLNAYGNYGLISSTPNLDRVIDDESFVLFDDPKNQEFNSFEIGLSKRVGNMLAVNANYYNTLWSNRTSKEEVENPNSGDDIFALISGIEQRNSGFEIEGTYQPSPIWKFDAAISLGNWTYTKDVDVRVTENNSQGEIVDQFDATVYIKDLKVGDAPQKQYYFSTSFTPIQDLLIRADYRHYTSFYSDFNPVGRFSLEDGERPQPWRVPHYGIMDIHVFYTIPLEDKGFSIQVFGHVFNALDNLYIQDAGDNSQFNSFDGDHDADDAEVFLGTPRWFNTGFVIRF